MTVDELREAAESQHGQVRSEKKARVRAESLKDKWKRNFDAAMEAAAQVVSGWRASASTRFSELLGEARAREEQLATLEQQLKQSTQQLEQTRMAAAAIGN